jgi:hypothetical protein
MSTKRSQILTAAKAALTGLTGVSDSNIYRSRAAAFARGETPAVVVEPVTDTPDNPTLQRLQWGMIFQVMVIVRDDSPDSAAEPIVNDIHHKIMTDSTLQGFAVQLLPGGLNWTIDDADKTLGIVAMQFKIDYQTSLNDIST